MIGYRVVGMNQVIFACTEKVAQPTNESTVDTRFLVQNVDGGGVSADQFDKRSGWSQAGHFGSESAVLLEVTYKGGNYIFGSTRVEGLDNM